MPETPNTTYDPDLVLPVRCHHLAVVSQMEKWKTGNSEKAAAFLRYWKSLKYSFFGYPWKASSLFAQHGVDLGTRILTGSTEAVSIINTHDYLCESCPRKGDGYCSTSFRKSDWDFLKSMDDYIAHKSGGIIQIGEAYPPDYIVQHLPEIRAALQQTFWSKELWKLIIRDCFRYRSAIKSTLKVPDLD